MGVPTRSYDLGVNPQSLAFLPSRDWRSSGFQEPCLYPLSRLSVRATDRNSCPRWRAFKVRHSQGGEVEKAAS
jgi:hypothetical protein